jgi:hypothetical protein
MMLITKRDLDEVANAVARHPDKDFVTNQDYFRMSHIAYELLRQLEAYMKAGTALQDWGTGDEELYAAKYARLTKIAEDFYSREKL